MTLLGKLLGVRRDLGSWNACLYLTGRLLESVTGGRARVVKYYLVVQPVAAAAALRPDPKTEIRRIGVGDPLVDDFPRPPAVIRDRFAHGATCAGALIAGRFAGFLWWQHDRYEEDEVRCTYVLRDAAHCVWDFDVHVEPAYRMGRTLARLWQFANDQLSAKDVRWTFSRISAFNAESIRSHSRMGMRFDRAVTFWLAGPVQLSWLGRRPYLHLSLSEHHRPRLELSMPASSLTGE